MKGRVVIFLLILLALVALWQAPDGFGRRDRDPSRGQSDGGASGSLSSEDRGTNPLPAKVSLRYPSNPQATHRPESLGQFYLPPVHIDGLPLAAALRKLQTAYEEACRESGETPLRLTFTVPPGHDRPLTVKIGTRTFDAGIRLLAAVSGLNVVRRGSEFVFEAPVENGDPRTRSFPVPPDFFNAPKSAEDPFNEAATPSKVSPADYFAGQGITLDPATRLKFSPGAGTVVIDTTRAADEVAVRGLIDLASSETPLQHKVEARVIELAAGTEWMPTDLAQLDEGQMRDLIHNLAEREAAQVATMPAITTRSGESASIQIGRELIAPVPGRTDEFETHWLGKNIDLRPVPLGFGHRVDLKFTETTVNPDFGQGAAPLDQRTDITNTSFSSDGKAGLHVQIRPDGTRTVLLVTPTLIDATGRPVRAAE